MNCNWLESVYFILPFGMYFPPIFCLFVIPSVKNNFDIISVNDVVEQYLYCKTSNNSRHIVDMLFMLWFSIQLSLLLY